MSYEHNNYYSNKAHDHGLIHDYMSGIALGNSTSNTAPPSYARADQNSQAAFYSRPEHFQPSEAERRERAQRSFERAIPQYIEPELPYSSFAAGLPRAPPAFIPMPVVDAETRGGASKELRNVPEMINGGKQKNKEGLKVKMGSGEAREDLTVDVGGIFLFFIIFLFVIFMYQYMSSMKEEIRELRQLLIGNSGGAGWH